MLNNPLSRIKSQDTTANNSPLPEHLAHDLEQLKTPQQALSTSKLSKMPQDVRKPGERSLLEDINAKISDKVKSGALATVVETTAFMPLHTITNYQYRYGGTGITADAKKLYQQGGMRRFWQGLPYVVARTPLHRAIDIAANTGAIATLEAREATKDLPMVTKTAVGSLASTAMQLPIIPLSTLGYSVQVDGNKAIPNLKNKIKNHGIGALWHGTMMGLTYQAVSHFPWFATYNALDASLPHYDNSVLNQARHGFVGATASAAACLVSNPFKTLRVYRQTHPEAISYKQATQEIMRQDGIRGMFGRGLKARLIAQILQGTTFNMLWKALQTQP